MIKMPIGRQNKKKLEVQRLQSIAHRKSNNEDHCMKINDFILYKKHYDRLNDDMDEVF